MPSLSVPSSSSCRHRRTQEHGRLPCDDFGRRVRHFVCEKNWGQQVSDRRIRCSLEHICTYIRGDTKDTRRPVYFHWHMQQEAKRDPQIDMRHMDSVRRTWPEIQSSQTKWRQRKPPSGENAVHALLVHASGQKEDIGEGNLLLHSHVQRPAWFAPDADANAVPPLLPLLLHAGATAALPHLVQKQVDVPCRPQRA